MNTAILILDLINDIVAPDGKIPTCAAQAAEKHLIEKTNTALEFARKKYWPVLLVSVGFSKHYLEHPENSPVFGKAKQLGALTLGEKGTQLHDGLKTASTDYLIVKHRISPFYGTALDVILRNKKIERLVICGVSTTWAVQAAARDAHDRDYQVVILEDACAAATAEEHQLSIQQLSRIAKIITTHELPALFSA